MNWAASIIPSENSSRESKFSLYQKRFRLQVGIWDTREVTGFPYLDIFKKIVGGCLSGPVCIQPCLETGSELDQHVLSCSQIWHLRKQVPCAALVTLLLCVEPPSKGHLPWSVRRMHEDRDLPAAEVRAGAGRGWEMLGPFQRLCLPKKDHRGDCHGSWWPLSLSLGPFEIHLLWALTCTHTYQLVNRLGTF